MLNASDQTRFLSIWALAAVFGMASASLALNDVWIGGFSTAGLPGARALATSPDGLIVTSTAVPGGLAIWDAGTWNYTGGSGPPSGIELIVRFGDDICSAGGTSGLGTHLACWDGNQWYEPGGTGNGPSSPVNAMAVVGNKLYIAGMFTEVNRATGNPLDVRYIAVWNGLAWSPVGGGVNAPVADMAVIGESIFLIGGFGQAGFNSPNPVAVNGIAAYKNGDWDDLDQGPVAFPVGSFRISASPAIPDVVYTRLGGFDQGTGNTTPVVAEWNDTTRQWSILAALSPGTALHDIFAAPNGKVYSHGDFSSFGDPAMDGIARWTGSTWEPLPNIDTIPDLSGFTILNWAGDDTNLFIAHQAIYSGETVYTGSILGFDGFEWWSFGEGVGRWDPTGFFGDQVRVLHSFRGDLYAGGVFPVAGDEPIATIARFDGVEWSSLAGGIEYSPVDPPFVEALAMFKGELYVGGKFTTVDGLVRSNVARWNGTSWNDVSVGISGGLGVHAAVSDDQHLYIGGDFSHAGATPADNLARWNGVSFEAVGGGLDGPVKTITLWSDRLCAGGTFSVADSVVLVNDIACWTGSSWEELEGGLTGGFPFTAANAVTSDDTHLYVGGAFSFAGVVPVSNVARWDGLQWESLGTGVDGAIYDLHLVEGRLFASGDFSNAGGSPANRIAVWDGANWSGIGEGLISGSGISLHHRPGTDCLYVGGVFSLVDSLNSNNVAILDLDIPVSLQEQSEEALERCLGSLLFADGFESADLAAWSGSSP